LATADRLAVIKKTSQPTGTKCKQIDSQFLKPKGRYLSAVFTGGAVTGDARVLLRRHADNTPTKNSACSRPCPASEAIGAVRS
jgi:hypothetical protein